MFYFKLYELKQDESDGFKVFILEDILICGCFGLVNLECGLNGYRMGS